MRCYCALGLSRKGETAAAWGQPSLPASRGPAPKGAGSPVGTWRSCYAPLLGRWVQQTREKKPSPLPPGSTTTWRRTPRGGRPLPGIQPNLDSASSAAKTPKPRSLAVHLSRLPALGPRTLPSFWRGSPWLPLRKAPGGPRDLRPNRPGPHSLPVDLRNKPTIKILATFCLESPGLTRVPE